MAFSELLQHVGDCGRFQILNIVLCVLVNLLTPSNELIENFSAAIPAHRCYVQLIDNSTFKASIAMNLSAEALLRVSIPMDPNQKPEQCRRFRQTHWELLDANVSVMSDAKLETETCLDGWVYDQSVFTSSIITEWDLVCDLKSLKLIVQSIFMTGFLVGVLLCGVLSDSWISESVPWLILTGKTEQALKELRRIAFINGKKDVAQSLTAETGGRFSTFLGNYGLLLDVQNLGMDMFLTQFLLGAVDLPNKCLTFYILRRIKRRPSLALFLLLSGSILIASVFVSKEMPILRLIIFLLGKSSFSTFNMIILAFINELSPTPLRTTLTGIYGSVTRLAAALSALVLLTRRYFVHLPMILYGFAPIIALICIYILPETFNLPLPDTIMDLEKRFMKKGTRKEKAKISWKRLAAKETQYAHRMEELGITSHNAK
ncbi:solute carrier family 22 member 22-like [Talpa occidentalis]|uniref:solute carrier family 22 member 22-like n=1 Tax=Talpa occidentalis TaxID=50954 RepID=UPI00188EBBD4|nr:solute carrier family 22 member 22-like [Talpa occidentalis]